MFKTVRILTVAVLAAALAGCAYQRSFLQPGYAVPAGTAVMVFPFDDFSTHPRGGEVVTAVFLAELRHSLPADITEALSVAAPAAQDEPLPAAQLAARPFARKLAMAREKGAALMLTGQVTEFKYKKGLGEEPVVGLTAQLVDVAGGNVVWSSAVSVTGGLSLGEQSLNRFAQKAARRMVCSIKKK